MNLLYSTNITLHTLEIRKDKKHFIVEDVHSGEFYEMPEVCIDAINMINDGNQLDLIESSLKAKYPDEDVDLIDFARQLLQLGLVKELDGEMINREPNESLQRGYSWISPKLGRFFINSLSVKIYQALILASIIIFIIKPDLFPHFQDIFIFDLMTENILVWLLITFLLVVIHEFGHVLSIRSHDMPTKIEVGHRLFLVVLETDMSKVWKLPPGQRNLLYLAGIYFDNAIMFAALLAQLFVPEKSIVAGVLGIIVMDTVLRLVYQCCVFMKTDFYYVLENMTGCYNLLESGQQFLRKWLPFLPDHKSTEAFIGEEKAVRIYAFFYLAGIIVAAGAWFFYYIPQLTYAAAEIAPGLSQSPESVRFWDAVVCIAQFIVVFGLLLYSWSKKYRPKN
ncbi:hypothetical protein [Bacillus sp. T33-2]|uniref:hypothetical protein n=1 Tax=Bacillus sp. T33-2 TaxID=2054168 RepID=UPI000C78E9B6|nr:hypothetical protein [Bacillus sp. T33-2]PLR96062.1 hypothetical protein CVD19_12170 [Bacillus sp. T33-2]